MMLWFSMVALTLATAAWLTRPLWRRGESRVVARRSANVAAYESRLHEVEADIAAGVLPASEADSLQQEMDTRLLADAAAPARDASPAVNARSATAPVLIAVLLPLFAALWYWQAESWRTADLIATAPAAGSVAAAPSPEQITAMVSQLAARLEASPDDAEGWGMLGRSYAVMTRHTDAAAAYRKANTLTGERNAEWLVGEGEALALSRERDLLGRPAALFEAALAVQPDYGKALWYGSLADAQGGNVARAGDRLQQLLAQDLPEDLKTLVVARLDELRGLAGASPQAAAPTPTGQPTAAVGTVLRVQVTLAPALVDRLPASATLFVFAKAAQGPPMPLAVQKLPGAKLPLTITLDDSMAMTPAMKLSSFDRYVITARLSLSGTALAAAGDLEGSAEAGRSSEGIVAVEINRAVP